MLLKGSTYVNGTAERRSVKVVMSYDFNLVVPKIGLTYSFDASQTQASDSPKIMAKRARSL